MMDNPDLSPNLDLGYIFSPPCHQGRPCHRRLDIVIQAMPTQNHCDPEIVFFMVPSARHKIEVIKVRHPWLWEQNLRVVASRVIMTDRTGKAVEAFTFGGDLQIVSEDEFTRCTLRSPAPILPCFSDSPFNTLLVEEVETLLAERREAWEEEHPTTFFDERLAASDPFILYLACLKAIHNKYIQLPANYLDEFTHFLQVEMQALHDERLWPSYLPPIEKLLQTDN